MTELVQKSPVAKICDLDDLASVLTRLRSEHKRIVHCHGVFDLLHVGHIRHLDRAKQLGDVLVVTLTPDRYVNKGPHRPVFNEGLRAEALAALSTVDYVAINKWPTAVETINLLRPRYYVKGSDYRDASADRTGGIALEEAEVRSVGGELVCTDELQFSSSNLINRHLSPFAPNVASYLADVRSRYCAGDIVGYLEQARALNVLVVGEAIIDDYHYCEAIGKSSKEPMLAVKRLSSETFAGGILAVANHVAGFCDRVTVLTVLGNENSHEEFIRRHLRPNVEPIFLKRENAPTIVKRRFVEQYFFTKLLEVYEMNDESFAEEDNRRFCEQLDAHVAAFDLVVVVDFGHGMLSDEAVDRLCRQAKFLAVNAQSNAGNLGYHTISRYPRADYVGMAENEIRLEARDRRGDLRRMVLDVAQRLQRGRVMVTRGKYGSLGYRDGEGFVEAPALAGQVIDRMGAGDASLSVTALCAVQGAPMQVVSFIGNAVGAQAVATVGHRTSVDRLSLSRHIESLLK